MTAYYHYERGQLWLWYRGRWQRWSHRIESASRAGEIARAYLRHKGFLAIEA